MVFRTLCILVLVGLPLTASSASSAAEHQRVPLSAGALARWGRAQYAFTASLERVDQGPVGRSYPPMYTHKLHFVVDEVLRGPLSSGDRVTCSHVARQHQRPSFPVGKKCLVTASLSRGGLRAEVVEQAEPGRNVAEAKLACSIPLGWSITNGALVSPWAAMGDKAWPDGLTDADALACARTGRPVLLMGEGVDLAVEPVPPEQEIKWTNPDGDGQYRITVRNTTNRPVSVPALLSDGDRILWAESLVILCQETVYACPGAEGVRTKVRPTRLAPEQSVSTVVNVLRLKGPTWPRGGYRIEFQFCLGERSNVQSLYYMSRHHDKLRLQAQGAGGADR